MQISWCGSWGGDGAARIIANCTTHTEEQGARMLLGAPGIATRSKEAEQRRNTAQREAERKQKAKKQKFGKQGSRKAMKQKIQQSSKRKSKQAEKKKWFAIRWQGGGNR